MQHLPKIFAVIGAIIAIYYCVTHQDPGADLLIRIFAAVVLIPITAALGFFIGRIARRILIGT